MIKRAPRPATERIGLNAALPVFVLVGIGALWQIVAGADPSRVRVVPAPNDIWAALIRTGESLLTQHIPTTMQETLIGLGLALVIGVGLAAALDFSTLLRRALYPLLILSQTIPLIALAPVLILIFGFGIEPKVTVVVLFCVFPITIATLDALTATDPDHVTLLLSMGASRWQVWRKVRLPTALPGLFSGLRIATTYSVTGAIFGEYITSNQGLGQYMRAAYAAARTDQAFVAIVITALLSIGLVAIVSGVERLMIPWYFARLHRAGWNETEID